MLCRFFFKLSLQLELALLFEPLLLEELLPCLFLSNRLTFGFFFRFNAPSLLFFLSLDPRSLALMEEVG